METSFVTYTNFWKVFSTLSKNKNEWKNEPVSIPLLSAAMTLYS